MTKLWIFSDLHYEMGNMMPDGPVPAHDVCVVPGDMGHLPHAIQMLKGGALGNGDTVYVCGNHDYYRQETMEGAERLAAANVEHTRVFLANPGEYVIAGVRFLGCTLWTDYELFGNRMAAMGHAGHYLNDHRLIRTQEHPGQSPPVMFSPDHALQRHKRERAWLEARLAEPFDGPVCVVSHHGPSIRSVPDRFLEDPLSPAFSSSLEPLIEKYQPDLWVHGHTHDSFDYNIGKARIVCNPGGYQHETNLDFSWDFVVELDDYEPSATMRS
jgi:predicted phosphodiesterase